MWSPRQRGKRLRPNVQLLLVANPLNRYLLNSPMLPQFKKDADGGLTFLIQNESPGQRQGEQLAFRPQGRLRRDHAPLLAERRSAHRQVDRPT